MSALGLFSCAHVWPARCDVVCVVVLVRSERRGSPATRRIATISHRRAAPIVIELGVSQRAHTVLVLLSRRGCQFRALRRQPCRRVVSCRRRVCVGVVWGRVVRWWWVVGGGGAVAAWGAQRSMMHVSN